MEYNASKWGYYITEPEFEPHELRLMVDSIQASKFITQAKARTISQKIVKLADVYTRESLTRDAFVSGRVRSMNDSVVQDSDRIHQAIAENRKIGFRYHHYTPNKQNPKQYSKKGDLYVVSPYALLWDGGNYYLYAYITEKDEFRTFRIDRMEAITNPLPDKRDGEKEFKAAALTNQEYKVFQQYHGEKTRVRIRFINPLLDAVVDRFGTKDVQYAKVGDTHFSVTAKVEISDQFFGWILGFGKKAKLLYPDDVIDQFKAYMDKIREMYKIKGTGI